MEEQENGVCISQGNDSEKWAQGKIMVGKEVIVPAKGLSLAF